MTTLANRVKPWALDLRSRPLLDYVVILGVVFILSGLGIVMVFFQFHGGVGAAG